MPSIKDVLKPIEVNLVEESKWKPWDPTESIMDWASQNAFESFQATGIQECREWLEDVIGTGAVSVKDWSPKGTAITVEDSDLVCTALMERGSSLEHLEGFFQLVVDALTFMYEEAYIPNDNDMEDALEDARDTVNHDYNTDEGVWEPIGWSEENIINEITQAVRYVRQEDHYDRFLKFDPSRIEPVRKLLALIDAGKGDPDITRAMYVSNLNYELENIFGDVLADFWVALGKEMEKVDVFNRTDWNAHWTNGVLEDKDAVKSAANGIRKFVREARKEEADA